MTGCHLLHISFCRHRLAALANAAPPDDSRWPCTDPHRPSICFLRQTCQRSSHHSGCHLWLWRCITVQPFRFLPGRMVHSTQGTGVWNLVGRHRGRRCGGTPHHELVSESIWLSDDPEDVGCHYCESSMSESRICNAKHARLPVAVHSDNTTDHKNQATSTLSAQWIDPAFESSLLPHPDILDPSSGEHHRRAGIFHAIHLSTVYAVPISSLVSCLP